ncbi:MAG TPA: phage major capsid protein [Solirubrobacteraceae bacterium]|jgi:HK97 family phage major capsid protein/HK97 family phage prohead protease|nr:phage major capsid protein [Solirubrobacteraceae bacterium]
MRSPSPVLEDRTETITEDRTAVVDVQDARVDGNTLHGFACIYGADSEPIEDRGRRFIETIERGAFADVLAGSPDTYLTLNHDPSRALARMPDSLRLHDEERGLRFEADLGDGPTAQDVRDAVRRKVLRGASFRFSVGENGDRWTRGGDGTERRTLTRIGRLVDISLATTPAYSGTSIELRSRQQQTPGLTVEMRSRLAAPAAVDETRARITLAPEDRVSTWFGRRGRSEYTDSDARDFSIGRAVRGLVTSDWTDADLEKRALAEGAGGTGGYAVPSPLATYTIDLIRNAARVVEAGATTVPMESETLTVPRLSAPPSAEWHVENEPLGESDPAFDRVTMKAHTVAVMTKISMELFEDISASASDRISNSLIQAIALELDRVALRGSGTGAEPLGLRNQEGIELRSMGTNGGKLTNWAALIAAVGALKGRNIMPTGIIESSRTAETLAGLTDTLGQPLMAPSYVSDIPVYETNQVPNNTKQGTSNAASEIYLGRWSDLLIGVRPSIGIRLRQLNERFADNLQIGLIAWLRADIAVAHPQSFNVITGVIE